MHDFVIFKLAGANLNFTKSNVELCNKKINFVFRMKSNNKCIQNFVGNDHIFDISLNKEKYVRCKIVKYKPNHEECYLLTNLIDHNVTSLSRYYWNRWKIETDFRKIKYDILFDVIRSKSKNQIILDVCIINFIGLLVSMIENLGKRYKNKKVHTKNTIYIIMYKLLNLLLYKNRNIEEIMRIIAIIISTYEILRQNRKFKRIRKFPSTKWNIYGNRYGAG